MSIQAASGQQSTASAEVEVTIPAGYTWFFIENATDQIDDLLYDELSWKDPDAQYKDAYKRGAWDGLHHLYKKDNHMAPIGLLDRAIEILEANGYTVSVTSEGDSSGDSISTEWTFSDELRNYQLQAVSNALENSGGMIALPTGAGKTVVAMNLINAIEQRTIVFVHTQELLYQWQERLEDTLGVAVGLIGDGQWNEGEVTVATMQTLNKRGLGNLNESYGIGIFDEAHVTSASEKFQQVGLDIDLEWRFGLSATPWRSVDGEEMEIEAAIGGEAVTVDAEQLIDEGYLAEPKFEFIEPTNARVPRSDESYQEVVKRCLELGPNRNQAVAEKANNLAGDGYTVLVTVNRIAQGHLLEYALDPTLDAQAVLDDLIEDDDEPGEQQMKARALEKMSQVGDHTAEFIQGPNTTKQRQEALSAFGDGDIDILISTVLKEGADIPSISAIVLAEGGKSKIEKIQRIGRALRPNDDHAVIADIEDRGEYLRDHYETRVENYKEYYGKYGPDNGFTPREQAVRNYLQENGVPLNACRVSENDLGTVTIELTDYLGDHDFQNFRSVMQRTSGITYDGSKNRCDLSWVRSLTQPSV
ncbi:DEAD/DEAH box helicase [Halosimplex pelagicum]|uniref:DEAD/DEAH box helicase n=1 Tax=Halosimplex pelagicum TaxID=869886 RepID=A0A7D5TSU8_9EURY|nr:DEAD/DEAH box helicase [Halosimplex pelagicum]QLH82232.1 DEAD/DEAH box helicase [Halosimplex pelagicum]